MLPSMVPQLLKCFPCLLEIRERSFDRLQFFPMEMPPLISSTLQKLILMCLRGGDDCVPSKTAVKASTAAILAWILIMNTNYLTQLTSEPSLLHFSRMWNFQQKRMFFCVWLTYGWGSYWCKIFWTYKGRLLVDHETSIQRKTVGLAPSIILTLRGATSP